MTGTKKILKAYTADHGDTKNLTYGYATLPWCDKRKGWVTPHGRVIVTRREAGDYVEKMHLLIKSMMDRKSIAK